MRALLSLLFALGLLVPATQAEDVDDARLIAAFDAIVFGTAGPRPRPIVLRVEGPVRFLVAGKLSARNEQLLERHAAALSAVTGYPVVLDRGEGPQEGERPFWIYVAAPIDMLPALDRSWIPAWATRVFPNEMCAFITRGDHRIKEAVITIRESLPEATIGHCLIEETAQSLGAIDDTYLLSPSAFNDFGPLVEGLTADDRLILRALFAAEVAAGDSREEVLARLPALIAAARAAESD